MKKEIIALVPVKETSERIKNKNTRPFYNTNLYELKLTQLRNVRGFARIIVSSESNQILETAKRYGFDIHVRDAAQICTNILDDKFAGETLILTGHHRMRLSAFLDMINEILGNDIKITYHPEASKSHYEQTPYSYIPNIGKKIAMGTYCDFGQSLVEILHEFDPKKSQEEIRI